MKTKRFVQFGTTKTGKRLVFGGGHVQLPFACTPKGWHDKVRIEEDRTGLAIVSWTEHRFGQTITRRHYIEHPFRRPFWLVGPAVGTVK